MKAKLLSWLIIVLLSISTLIGCTVHRGWDYDHDRDYGHGRDHRIYDDRDDMHHRR